MTFEACVEESTNSNRRAEMEAAAAAAAAAAMQQGTSLVQLGAPGGLGGSLLVQHCIEV
jgi:hypothetical protein